VFDPAIEHAIYRIIQEAVNNACQHSKSDHVQIDLGRRRGGNIYIKVRDWGIGFDPSATRKGSYGLDSMRQRAQLLGGRVVIDTAPGRGTQIEVDLPDGQAEPRR